MSAEELVAMGSFFFAMAVAFGLIMLISFVTTVRKSKQYRTTLTDMYVAAKTKDLAKADGLDLVEEYECFKKWLKKERIRDHSLDFTIEEELQERIAEPSKPKGK